LDLSVRTGEFYTLLGPNGAGKTTTLQMVTGLLKPDRGSITVFGIDTFGRSGLGVKNAGAWLSDEPMIYDKLTPMEYLHFVAGLWAVASGLAELRARDLIGGHVDPDALVMIADRDDRKFAALATEAKLPLVTNDNHILAQQRAIGIEILFAARFVARQRLDIL
jgi:ABC-type Na+ transport system ATPase subunit NatA